MILLALGFCIFGAALCCIAALGMVRLPDVLLRIHAVGLASSLGAFFVLLGTALAFDDMAVALRCGLICFFLLITSPISSHLLGRAAYQQGIELWHKTKRVGVAENLAKNKEKTDIATKQAGLF